MDKSSVSGARELSVDVTTEPMPSGNKSAAKHEYKDKKKTKEAKPAKEKAPK